MDEVRWLKELIDATPDSGRLWHLERELALLSGPDAHRILAKTERGVMDEVQWLTQRLNALLYGPDAEQILAKIYALTEERDAVIRRANELAAQIDDLHDNERLLRRQLLDRDTRISDLVTELDSKERAIVQLLKVVEE